MKKSLSLIALTCISCISFNTYASFNTQGLCTLKLGGNKGSIMFADEDFDTETSIRVDMLSPILPMKLTIAELNSDPAFGDADIWLSRGYEYEDRFRQGDSIIGERDRLQFTLTPRVDIATTELKAGKYKVNAVVTLTCGE